MTWKRQRGRSAAAALWHTHYPRLHERADAYMYLLARLPPNCTLYICRAAVVIRHRFCAPVPETTGTIAPCPRLQLTSAAPVAASSPPPLSLPITRLWLGTAASHNTLLQCRAVPYRAVLCCALHGWVTHTACLERVRARHGAPDNGLGLSSG